MIYYCKMLAVICVAVFYTYVPGYVAKMPGSEKVAPWLWVVGFIVISLPWLIRQVLRTNILKSPLLIWCFGYAWLTVAWFFLSSQSDMAWQEVRYRFLAIVELLVFLALFTNPDAARLARQTLVVGVLFGVALNIYELFVPMSFSQFIGRSAGLYLHPNLAGEALVLGMIFSVTVLPSWLRGPFILLTGIGILTTFSRGSILAWVIAVTGFIFQGRISLKDMFLSISMSLLLVVLVLLPRWDQLLTTLERSGVINKNVEERMEWLTNPSGVSDSSSLDRQQLARRAWEKVADRPYLGSGTGSSREAFTEAHNQYLAFMQDHGFLGAAVLPLLVLAVGWGVRGESRGMAMVFGCTAMELSLFTHNFLNEEYSLMLFALMAAMTLTSRESEIKRTQVMTAEEVNAAKALVGF